MSVMPAVAHKHEAHEHEGIEFDGASEHDQDGIDKLARSMVEGEAKKDGDGLPDAKEAQPTPPDAKKAKPVDPAAGKTVEVGGGAHTVGKGDSLWSLANATYGSGTYWHEIKKANKSKVHGAQNIIRDGDVLQLPRLTIPTLTAFKNFEDQPEQLRDLVVSMSPDEYAGFIQNTPPKELDKNGHLVQIVEMMHSTGMTPDEMADDQKQFIEAEAKKAGKSPGEYVRDLIKKEGYGGGTAEHWNKMSKKEQGKWQQRFFKAVKEIKATAPADVKAIIKDAEAKGGGFRWHPEETEKLGAFAYTSGGHWDLSCGTRWVEAAETNISGVYGNIAHEMGGHNYYGAELGDEIQDAAIDKLGEDEKKTALSDGNSMFSAYGYMETEIFAELYEFTYATKGNPSDTPFEVDAKGNDLSKEKKVGDVKFQLKRIKAAFSPKVAEGLVRSLWRRVQVDPRILDKGKELFARDVRTVYGIELT